MLPVLFQGALGFGGFNQMISNMTNLGFFQFLFPFLLALAIFYGVMKVVLPEKMSNSAIGLIALILAFFVMLFASANPGIVTFMQNLSGTALMAATGILFVIILLGLSGLSIGSILGKETPMGIRLFGLLIAAIVIVLFFGAGTTYLLPSVSVGSDFWTIVFFIVILAVVLWFLGRGGEEKKAPEPARGGGRPPGG